jgi:hypothetical protein
MNPHLERRYATLLRAYPRAYRSERGDELLGTLLAVVLSTRRAVRQRARY